MYIHIDSCFSNEYFVPFVNLGKIERKIERENFKWFYLDPKCLLADYERYEAKIKGNTKKARAAAKQQVDKLTKIWQEVDGTMSLTDNTFADANNLDRMYVIHTNYLAKMLLFVKKKTM